ncbi:bifunctional phosphoribosylaminoimidazolecarboxamide formyltransferase/IMP cyclohydrolase [Micromonospora sp. HM5-17]|uniref:bifunctional phosphoribosylaminoimidazolecarboxamide formyltransferase/IMP cyclohydrolase n=1 Tax=Micromonospora sp. HM5-17 TaxID=2487710 RepID=UPI000F480707|nr:bifunctional phosphoribosylaminoimidazolecarboxamide formyltransferase/IMP cyclohydrolase [Micromonospora sp. HM5-17]ROT25845.1 bifunctional phosphoribosylaminoimidazolecarboxamide formyltransferase/IMP cyclohydrolase PurH [Micromonospora sp. HM5-17]
MTEPVSSARIVVLASGSGSNLQALLDACADPRYGAQVVAVGADRDQIGALDRAAAAGVPTFVVPVSAYPAREDWDRALTAHVAEHRPDLVVSAGFLKLVGAHFLAAFGDRYVNTHNSLLPAFPGIHGPRDALAYGVKVAGATLFFVDAGVDTGPIVAQVAVPVLDDDDEESLTERIKEAERRQLVTYVGRLVREGWTITGRKVTIGVSDTSSAAEGRRPIRRALVSVYDKTGLTELAQALHAAGVEIVSTGSTAATIEAAGVPVTPVEALTGFPETLDGRVKTLHPKVHAGLLADLRSDRHVAQLAELGIAPFDLLVSNLYPFAETVASGADVDRCVEQIDIGGPAMVRAAAKNYASVAVVTSVSAYPSVLAALADGGFTLAQRRALAARAFADIAEYDVAVANWFAAQARPADQQWPTFAGLALTVAAPLRYGENPHQRAALYTDPSSPAGLAQAEQLHGKEMSYNNYVDADAAWRAANDFADEPAVAIIKHANPCGIAVGADVAEAHRKAHACDPVSAFGGVIAVNRPVSVELAKQIAEVFTEVVVAPDYEPGAVDVLSAKKNIRLLRAPAWAPPAAEWRQVSGGVLMQLADRVDAPGDDPAGWRLVTGEPADAATLRDLAFAWRAVRAVKSNAILLAADGATVGIGMGQVNRVDSAYLAVRRAGADRARGAVAASDAFFPFPDGLQVLIDAGVRAVVQPGGSVRDEEVVAAAQAAGITMYLTGTRHFFH